MQVRLPAKGSVGAKIMVKVWFPLLQMLLSKVVHMMLQKHVLLQHGTTFSQSFFVPTGIAAHNISVPIQSERKKRSKTDITTRRLRRRFSPADSQCDSVNVIDNPNEHEDCPTPEGKSEHFFS